MSAKQGIYWPSQYSVTFVFLNLMKIDNKCEENYTKCTPDFSKMIQFYFGDI